MNLVVGATGLVGFEVCRVLAARGQGVRALVRPTARPERVEALRGLGVDIAQGDLKDRASLAGACAGVTAVISTAATTLSRRADDSLQAADLDGQCHLIDEAARAGSRWFVYVSFSSGAQTRGSPLEKVKRAVESHLASSALAYTVLRPTFFMETFLGPAGGVYPAEGRAKIYGSGRNPVSWIAATDVARFAVEVVGDEAAKNATFELGGPEALCPQDVVEIFEDLAGRPFDIEPVPIAKLAEQQQATADPYQASYLGLALALAEGDVIDMREVLAAFPLALKTVREFAAETLGDGA